MLGRTNTGCTVGGVPEQVLYRTSFRCPYTVMGGGQVGKEQSASIPALGGRATVRKDFLAFGRPTIGGEGVVSAFTKAPAYCSRCDA